MKELKVTITNEAGLVTGEYIIACMNRPGLNVEKYDTLYTINLIRAAAERHNYLSDFVELPPLSLASPTLDVANPLRAIHLNNVNELWLEIQNLNGLPKMVPGTETPPVWGSSVSILIFRA